MPVFESASHPLARAPVLVRVRSGLLSDSLEARRNVAAVLYVTFVPLATVVEWDLGAAERAPWLFGAATAFLVFQLVLSVVLRRLSDRVSLFLVFAVPATFAAYVLSAPAAGHLLWPCLTLPVAWASVFLSSRLVGLAVLLNGLATTTLLLHRDVETGSLLSVVIRVLTLAVMAVIVHGLVSWLREARDDADRTRAEHARLARSLQQTLLPPTVPDTPGLDVAARYHPMGHGVEIGGDFYDVFSVGDGCWFTLVGDVCGKGVEAAALTGVARHTARAVAHYDHDPSAVLRALNHALLRFAGDRFCTVAAVRARLADTGCEITVCCGGHPPPILVRANGNTQRAGTPGDLLGVLDDPRLQNQTVRMGTGDALFIYTDGVTEARLKDDLVGEDGLLAILATQPPISAATLADTVLHAIVAEGGQPRDDIAIVVIRAVGATGGGGSRA